MLLQTTKRKVSDRKPRAYNDADVFYHSLVANIRQTLLTSAIVVVPRLTLKDIGIRLNLDAPVWAMLRKLGNDGLLVCKLSLSQNEPGKFYPSMTDDLYAVYDYNVKLNGACRQWGQVSAAITEEEERYKTRNA